MIPVRDGDARLEAALIASEDDLARYFDRRVSSAADAADAYGEFLLTAWKSRRKTPEDPDAARLWLYGVARNVLNNVRRAAARRRKAGDQLAAAVMTESSAPDLEALLDVRTAIASLDPDDAELVRLIYWDGLRSHEAAQVLGINASTARSRLAEAKRRLRAVLDPVLRV